MKKTLVIIVVILGITALGHAVIAAPQAVYGYACTQNIGCFSLNSFSSVGQPGYAAQPASFGVQYDTSSEEFVSGTSGWSPVVGPINFGVTCPASITSVISGSGSGKKCASIPLATTGGTETGGWLGYVYLGDVRISSPGASTFSGKGWEGYDSDQGGQTPADVGIGWIDFSNAGLNPVFCGPANGQVVTAAPTTGLCSDGSTPIVSPMSASGYYLWTCGSNSCSARDQGYVATCDVNATTIPTRTIPSPLCAPGSSASAVSGTAPGPYTWTCTNSLDVITCSSVVPGGSGSVPGTLKPIYKEN